MCSVDVDRIRLVTHYYEDIQGFRRCFLGASLLAGAWTAQQVPTTGFGFFVPFLVGLGLAVPANLWCDRYYKSRFGRVLQHRDDAVQRGTRRGIVIGILFFIATQLDSRGAGHGLPSALFAVRAANVAWLLIRDWPHRKYLVLDVCAAVGASAMYIDAQAVRSVEEWLRNYRYWAGLGLLGASALVTGVFDHRLLATTLRNRRTALTDAEHVDAI